MRRAQLIPIVALFFAIAAPAVAQAADVTLVYPRGDGSKTVSLDSLAGSFDVDDQYSLVGASGRTTTKQIHGISLRALLAALDAENTYSAVTVTRPEGGSVRISRPQIEAGGLGPVVYPDAGNATFLRPSYRSGDQNAADVVSASNLVISQVDGVDYKIKEKASKRKVKAGETVTFSATASGSAGEKLRFSWTFGDETPNGEGTTVRHKFKSRGTFNVFVTVYGESDPNGQSAPVMDILVGKPVKSKTKRSGGGTNNSAAAPVSGQADGSTGNGDTAGATPTPARRKSARTKAAPEKSPNSLETVSGELLTSPTPEQQSELAARTGQQLKTKPNSGGGIPDDAYGVAAALALLGFGAALEFGGVGGLRRKRS